MHTIESGGYKVVSATGNIAPQPMAMRGFLVTAASATPTIAIYDSATTTTTAPIMQVLTPVAGQYYPLPAMAMNGVYVVISGTVAATVFMDPETTI